MQNSLTFIINLIQLWDTIKGNKMKTTNEKLFDVDVFLSNNNEIKSLKNQFVKKACIYNSYIEYCKTNNLNILTSNKFWRQVKSIHPEIIITRLRGENSVREYFVKFNNGGQV